MSWTDPCKKCGQHRADCFCNDWNSIKKDSDIILKYKADFQKMFDEVDNLVVRYCQIVECVIGKQIKFDKNNKLQFMQDHGFWKGIPHNVKFTINEHVNHSFKLTADGYGVLKGKAGSYGNGAIYVNDVVIIKQILK